MWGVTSGDWASRPYPQIPPKSLFFQHDLHGYPRILCFRQFARPCSFLLCAFLARMGCSTSIVSMSVPSLFQALSYSRLTSGATSVVSRGPWQTEVIPSGKASVRRSRFRACAFSVLLPRAIPARKKSPLQCLLRFARIGSFSPAHFRYIQACPRCPERDKWLPIPRRLFAKAVSGCPLPKLPDPL